MIECCVAMLKEMAVSFKSIVGIKQSVNFKAIQLNEITAACAFSTTSTQKKK